MLEKMWASPFSILLLMITFSLVLTYSRLLPQQEKNALKEIAEQLGKKGWDFDANPCDVGNTNWNTPTDNTSTYQNNVTCNCSIPNNGFCHVESILLKGQDLAGVLPPSLVKLPYLKKIDLARNYLSGTIPPEWASTKVEYMSVLVNQLSGPIPKYLENMTALLYMSLENNMFSGTIPKELGNMVNLQNLTLSFNNLTGKLPVELNKLTNLLELRLSGNNFTGKLPSFESFKNLQKLEIQASGFEGPVSQSISVLTGMSELIISDLTGSASEFPPLENMTGLSRLMLRNCNISGKIPSYLAKMPQLQIL
uniref:Probable leucine-rich repeat receptor-like serine/threonine-protein kinase At3g14840 n=1 Tax=Nicotiana tabacum TaxID=4097 RepID=A0A1S3Y8W2_TOBAC|nr:PREDICTED: probable leucine-rich repeat receptor-like serine/threonine-protein kinase At3g14840 [Nicotiana tabacum]